MFVLKNIGPVIIGGRTHRFRVGEKLSDEQCEYFKKTKQIEALKTSGIIGDRKQDESLRSSQSGQSGDSDEIGRNVPGDDSNESSDSKRGNKRKSI